MSGASILLVGCGNMGGALLGGWVGQGRADDVTVIDPNPNAVAPGVAVLASAAGHDRSASVVVLAVKPQSLGTVAPSLERLVAPATILVSVLAAVEIATLRRLFPRARAVVRAVPNLPASIAAGVTALAADELDVDARKLVGELFEPLGAVEWLAREALADAATSVSGCGPAFLFRFADAVIRAGIEQGLDAAQARRLFAATMIGAGKMLIANSESAGDMASRVASPGGVTQAGLEVLDRNGALAGLVAETLAAAARRSAEMALAGRF